MNHKIFVPVLILVLVFVACPNNEEGCNDCGGTIIDGYFFSEVTIEDLTVLVDIEGIEVGACIRFKLDGTEFDLETVKVVDDCCCVE